MVTTVSNEPQLELWQLAVRLDVLMCYPNQPARRLRLENAIGARMVRLTLNTVPPRERKALAAELMGRFPNYNQEAVRRATGRFLEHMHAEAGRAGQIVLAQISKAATGKFPHFMGRERQPSVADIARFISPVKEYRDDKDTLRQFRRDRVAAWRPVAHLVAAHQLLARYYAAQGLGVSFDYYDQTYF